MDSKGSQLIGKYQVVRLIGEGGMGRVYECRHEALGTQVAVKFLHEELARRPALAERFLREARVSATIQSPHVARVIDVDRTPEGAPFFVMELLAGESLQALLDRTPKLDRAQAVEFTRQVLLGLEAAHALGIVHRDIKPDNVFVTRSPEGPLLKIIDFGIAKLRESPEYPERLTRAGVVMGTPEYMAPEQLYAASEVDARADLYSVGVMLYEMLSGQRPASGATPEAIIHEVTSGRVTPLLERAPELPTDLAALVHQALAADRNHRFESARAMRRALEVIAGQPRGDALALPTHEKNGLTQAQTPIAVPAPMPRTLPPNELGHERPAGTLPEAPRLGHGTEPVPVVSAGEVALGLGPVPRTEPDRAPRRRWLWALGALGALVLLTSLGVGAGIWFEVLENPFELPEPPPLPAFTPPAIDTAASPPADGQDPTPPSATQERLPHGTPPTPPPTAPKTRPPKDPSDSNPKPDPTPGTGFPPISFPTGLPTSLPPLPSTFPTALPPIPGFPLPGSDKKDGG